MLPHSSQALRHRRRFTTLTGTVLIAGLLGCATAFAQSTPLVRIVLGDSTETSKRVADRLRVRLPSAQQILDLNSALPKKANAVYVAIGPIALQNLLARNLEDPIVSILVSSLRFRELLAMAGKPRNGIVTCVFGEADPEAQLQLTARIFDHSPRVAVLLSQQTAYLQPLLRTAAVHANVEIEFIRIDEGENLARVVNRLTDVSAILAVPDRSVFNTETIRNILLTTYQHNQAVIGFSTSLVKAGALATTYSTVEDMTEQVVEIVREWITTGKLPPPQFPKYFSVLVNENVAKSLNLVIDTTVTSFSRVPLGPP